MTRIIADTTCGLDPDMARQLGIPPGIVVGRLQTEGWVPWKSPLNRLKVRYQWQDS